MSKLDQFIGHPVVDCNGTRIGTLEDFYRDDRSGRALWLKVKTGWFGHHSSFVTVEGSEPRDDDVVLGVTRDIVRHAPVVGRDGPLSATEDAELKAYYAPLVPARSARSNAARGPTKPAHGAKRPAGGRATGRSD